MFLSHLPVRTLRVGLIQALGRMGIVIGATLFLGLLVALALLFAASASLRSLVRTHLPEHERKLLLPAGDWYLPQNVFGNLRPIALFQAQPDRLVDSPTFRSTLAQARVLLLAILAGLFALLVFAVAA